MQPDANRLSMPIFILSVTQDSSMQEVMDMRHCLARRDQVVPSLYRYNVTRGFF